MLVDEARIVIKAGDGGTGIVHFYSDSFRPKGGPDGGNGGDGGSIYFRAVSDISKLAQFRPNKHYEAESGDPGGKNQRSGHNGADLILDIPVGSVINYDNGTSAELTDPGQLFLAARGGEGGRGNYSYRSSTNQQPKEFKPGFKPEPKTIFIELKLFADIGLIGLPNAGKSSLLNELTAANAKVANYAFTTLEPNLGALPGGRIIADIPGLIEGAHEGKGLGFKFLKHIERTRIIVHCLAADSADPQGDYEVIRHELDNYSSVLAKKQEILIITKSDLIDDPKKLISLIKKTHATMAVSIIDTESIQKLHRLLSSTLS